MLAREKPSVVIPELDGNDALRGLSFTSSEGNIKVVIGASQTADARVLLVSMRIPPNYGPDYSKHFSVIFNKLVQRYKLPLIPFLLGGVA